QGAELQVNSTTTGDQIYPSISMDGDSRFLVVWNSNDNGDWDVNAQQFNADGTALGIEFQANTDFTGNQQYASVAANGQGRIAVAWSGASAADADGMYAQRFVIGANDLSLEQSLQVNPSDGGTATFSPASPQEVAIDAA